MELSFRDRVIAEAVKQREYRQAGKNVPPEFKRYARLSGALLGVTGAVAAVLIAWLAEASGSLYVLVLLLGVTVGAVGFLQLATGKHMLTRR